MIFYQRTGPPRTTYLQGGRFWWSERTLVERTRRFDFCGARQRLNDSIRSRKHDYG